MGETLAVLTEAERALLIPFLGRLRELDGERAATMNAIALAVQMRAGRADVVLDTGTWEIRVSGEAEAGGDAPGLSTGAGG